MSTFRRPIDNAESLRSTRRSLGDGTVTGRSRLAMPPQNKARGTGLQRLSAPAVDGDPLGECITVQATSVAVSTTPTVIAFDEVLGETEGFVFLGNEVTPSADIRPTILDAYYDVQVELVRGGFGGTVKVEVLRGNEVVWPLRSPSYWDNPTVPVTAKGRLVDPTLLPFRIRLTADGAGTLAAVVVTAELVDRPRPNLRLGPWEPSDPTLWTACTEAVRLDAVEECSVVTPPDTAEGDWLFALSVTTGNSSTSDLTGHNVPAGWTELYDSGWLNIDSGSRRARAKLHYRRADASDVAGSGSYTWQVVGADGRNKSLSVTMSRWPAAEFSSLGTPAADEIAKFSTATPILSVSPSGGEGALLFGAATRALLTVGSANYGSGFVTPTIQTVGRYTTTGSDYGEGERLNFPAGAGRRSGFHYHGLVTSTQPVEFIVGEQQTHGWLIAVPRIG